MYVYGQVFNTEEEGVLKMKRAVFFLMCVFLVGSTTSFAVVVYEDNYNSYTPGDDFPGAWNWCDGGCTHTAQYADYGSIVVEHVAEISNTGDAAVNMRFGSKWGITMNGNNTSDDPADYTISFDLCNLQGNWDPHRLEFFVLTGGGNGVGYGSGGYDIYQVEGTTTDIPAADNWYHISHNLADLTATWWAGTDWDMTATDWQIEVGGPGWPGVPVEPGESWTQIFLMDNLEITMIPEPATIALLGLGALALLRRRKS